MVVATVNSGSADLIHLLKVRTLSLLSKSYPQLEFAFQMLTDLHAVVDGHEALACAKIA